MPEARFHCVESIKARQIRVVQLGHIPGHLKSSRFSLFFRTYLIAKYQAPIASNCCRSAHLIAAFTMVFPLGSAKVNYTCRLNGALIEAEEHVAQLKNKFENRDQIYVCMCVCYCVSSIGVVIAFGQTGIRQLIVLATITKCVIWRRLK